MKRLNSHKISSAWGVEIMRNIYNENLDMLSTTEIPYRTYEEQQRWWILNKSKLNAYLYEKSDVPGSYIAFLVLTDRGGFYTPIFAIKKEEWGNKYGTEIISDYIEKANGPLAGSQLKSNLPICHMNKKKGWQILKEINQDGKIVQLLYHKGINPKRFNEPDTYKKISQYLNQKYCSNNNKPL